MALPRALVSAAWLAEAGCGGAGPRVLDASWHLPKMGRDARREFGAGHVAGGVFFELDGCSDPAAPGRHMMPAPEHFGRCAGELGIEGRDHLVVYDASELGQFSAPRVWWMFRAFGHPGPVSVLDGGLVGWRREGRPLTPELQCYPRTDYCPHPKPWVKTYQQVLDNIQSKEFQLVDARAEGRFRGTQPEPREDKGENGKRATPGRSRAAARLVNTNKKGAKKTLEGIRRQGKKNKATVKDKVFKSALGFGTQPGKEGKGSPGDRGGEEGREERIHGERIQEV
ncbi:3-mercaptopyruvate sulfurtransferase-like isoform X2 [Scyliorhinus torazame]|uniref:3-mercaptopyruvate sulfurtransferase-like isoform X2 n=1 Tax=Scyliorhinus torazame TaxID=75743 RepID=UPI003B5CE3E8